MWLQDSELTAKVGTVPTAYILLIQQRPFAKFAIMLS